MQRCHVTGSTVATQKAAGLTGFSLLTVTPVEGGGELVAVDLVGAGEGDMVLVAMGGAARETDQTRAVPTDAAVVAIVDPSRERWATSAPSSRSTPCSRRWGPTVGRTGKADRRPPGSRK